MVQLRVESQPLIITTGPLLRRLAAVAAHLPVRGLLTSNAVFAGRTFAARLTCELPVSAPDSQRGNGVAKIAMLELDGYQPRRVAD